MLSYRGPLVPHRCNSEFRDLRNLSSVSWGILYHKSGVVYTEEPGQAEPKGHIIAGMVRHGKGRETEARVRVCVWQDKPG